MTNSGSVDGAEPTVSNVPLPQFRGRETRTAADNALVDLVDTLRLGTIGVGDRLPPLRDIASAVGISHANVRQALKVLEQADVVSVRPGRGGGIFVTNLGHIPVALSSLYPPVPDSEVDMLLEAWSITEREVLLLAAERATPEGLATLHEKLVALEEHPSPVIEFSERTVHFHITAATMGGNVFLRKQFTELMNKVAFVAARQGYLEQVSRARLDATIKHYSLLYQGIASRDRDLIRRTVGERLALQIQLKNESGT